MNTEDFEENPENIQRLLTAHCKSWNAPIAVIGSKDSATFLVSCLKEADVPVAGVFDNNPESDSLNGFRVQPLEEVSQLKPNCVAVVASSAPVTDLAETYDFLRANCPCRVVPMSSLLDFFSLTRELEIPLDLKYKEPLLSGLCELLLQSPQPWHYLPEELNLEGKTVLELGPFDGHFSLQLMQRKPRQVIGLEIRPANYAKVASLKALMDWPNYSLRLGDMHLFPEIVTEPLDVIFASGVLYHSDKPWWFLKTCMQCCDTIILSTHVASEHSPGPRKFREVDLEIGPCTFELFGEGGDGLSGTSAISLWFEEKDMERYLDHYGFSYRKYNEWTNPSGLWICAIAQKR